MMHRIRYTLSLILGTILISPTTAPPVVAQEQEAGHCPGRLEALDLAYRQELRAIERRWIADLADMADESSGREANDAYRRLFNLAIARDLCTDAQPAAQSCLASIPLGEAEPAPRTGFASIPWAQDLRALATSVQVFARDEKGEYDQSLADLKALFKRPGCGPQAAAKSDAATAFAVGEAYFQRLIRSGRYDVARKLCELACKDDALAALKGHFEARMARLDLLDKPAPAISGTDVDGRQVSLADLKGKVVLVNFRESWCSHCAGSSAPLNALAQKYYRRGFVILGVNLDATQSDVKDGTTALATARQCTDRRGVTWIYLLDSQRTGNVTTAYGVEESPANFLIGRGGRIFAVEQSGDALERSIVCALGGLSGGHFR
jgi:peroxiredoxin